MLRFIGLWQITGTSTKAFLKGVETWKQETILKKVLDFFYNILFKVRAKRDLNLVTRVMLGSLIIGAFNPYYKDLVDYIVSTKEAERVCVENVTAWSTASCNCRYFQIKS